jgi:glycosyltransferase involved in cell wall biosynthesis
VEAALSRCAVVANDIPTFREIWGDSVYYFAINDADSLKHALERMAAEPELRISYGNRAYDHARRHFTADRMVDAYLKLYQTMVAAEVTAG